MKVAETLSARLHSESGHEGRERGSHHRHDGRGGGRRGGAEAGGDGGAGAARVGAAAVAAALPQAPAVLLVAPLLLLRVVPDDSVPGAGAGRRLGQQAGQDRHGGEDRE